MTTKEQRATKMREWRAKNKERAREISRKGNAKYEAAHPEAQERKRAWYLMHRPELKVKDHIVPKKGTEEWKEYQRKYHQAYYLAHKEEKYAANKRYAEMHPEKLAEQRRTANKRYSERHPHRERERRRTHRQEILDFFGGKCSQCGFSDARALHLDHINGGGWRERKKGSGTIREQYRLIKSDPEAAHMKYQLLCANCHALKWSK